MTIYRHSPPVSKSPPYQLWVLCLIIGVLMIRLYALIISPLGLHGDEAQYWTWSQNLDWGYFTKPPLIAWVIWITTSMFGDAEWAVRLSSPILHAITAFVIFRTARFAFDSQTGFWAAAIYFLMPALWLSSAIISTDVSLLLCWATALNAWLHIRESARWPHFIQLGLALGFGLLAKYAMLFFLPALGLAYIIDTQTRQGLNTIKGLVAGVLAFVVFLPNILWNYSHNFATISHTVDNANLETGNFPLHPLELFTFWSEQFVVFGPITGILLILALLFSFRGKLETPTHWISLFALSPLIFISIQALISRANANWAVTAYIAGSILTAHLGIKYAMRFKRWLIGAIIAQSIACLVVGVILMSPSLTDSSGLANSVKRLRKWPETVQHVEAIYKLGHDDTAYQTLALDKRIIFYNFSYYGLSQSLPMKMWKYEAKPSNHAELSAPLTAQAGPVLILNYETGYEDELQEDFQKLIRLEDLNIDLGGGKRRVLRVWAGYNYTPTKGRK